MTGEITQVLTFITEIEALKSVLRKSRPVGLERYENSAEHSWHVCLTALLLKDYANEPVNIDRVIRMMLVHDLGEIDAGDTLVYVGETPEIKAKEKAGVARLLGLLPAGQAAELQALWDEFDAGISCDARYARAIDRIPPLLQNLHGDGHSWRQNAVAPERILGLNARIGEGSATVWEVIRAQLEQAFAAGILNGG